MTRVTVPTKIPGDQFLADEANEVTAAINTLGTAADCNVGASAGNVPLLNSSGKLDISVIPDVLLGDSTPGDVIGPVGAADGRPAIFDGSTGKQIREGAAALLVPSSGTDGQFLQRASGAGVWVDADEIQTALDALDANDVAQYTIRGRVSSGTGAKENLTPAQALTVLLEAPTEDKSDFATDIITGITQTPAVVTYALHLAGSSVASYYTPYANTILNAPQSVAYAATVTLDYSSSGNVTSRNTYVNCTGNCAVVFDNMPAGLIGQEIQQVLYNTSGGSITVGPTIGTTNDIVVKHANTSILNPTIGTAAGDGLLVIYWVKTATEIVVRAYQKYTA